MAASCEKKEKSTEVGTGMRMTIRMIRTKFPSVNQMQTEELEKLLSFSAEQGSKVVLLDVRDKKEFKVSHIQDAHFIKSSTNMAEILTLINQQVSNPQDSKTVVAYCSVGYRSSSLIQELMKKLTKPEYIQERNSIDMYNLEGSIFKWANEGRPIVNCDDRPVLAVHPYNFIWGKLLNNELVNYGEDIS